MKRKVKIITLVISISLLIISFTQNAVVVNRTSPEPQSSFLYFLMGATAILGGGLFEWIVWLANPLSLITILNLWKDRKTAIITSIFATILSGSFFFWKELLVSESGRMARIISFETGYYLWFLSILILNLGVLYNFSSIGNSEKDTL